MRDQIREKNYKAKMKTNYQKYSLIRRRPKSSEKLVLKPEH